MADILVINPNSSPSVTRSMEACLDIVSATTHHTLTCIELPRSPPGIETDDHVAEVIPHVLEAVAASDAEAFVLSCFSDSGINVVRRATSKPVIGIAESAYLAAISLGNRFGIVSLGPSSIVLSSSCASLAFQVAGVRDRIARSASAPGWIAPFCGQRPKKRAGRSLSMRAVIAAASPGR